MVSFYPHCISCIQFLLAVAAAGSFVAVKAAIVRARTEVISTQAGGRKLSGHAALKLLEASEEANAVSRVGMVLFCILSGIWGVEAFGALFLSFASWAGFPLNMFATKTFSALIGLFFAVGIYIVMVEFFARSVAAHKPEQTLLFFAVPFWIITFIFRKPAATLRTIASWVLRPLKLGVIEEFGRVHSMSELEEIVAQSSEVGGIDKSEEEMLKRVFSFSDTIAREVMTPRTNIAAVSGTSTLTDVLSIVREAGFSRFPVYGKNIDDILGILLTKDLMTFIGDQSTSGASLLFDVTKIMRPAYFVSGRKPISDVLNELKRRKVHMAVVMDEHGGVDGIVTLEDLLEEIVGDILDELDVPEKEVQLMPNGELVVDGGVLVHDLNNEFHFDLPVGDYDTIAGLILSTLGRAPVNSEILYCLSSDQTVQLASSSGLPESLGELSQVKVQKPPGNGLSAGTMLTVMKVEQVTGYHIDSIRISRFAVEKPIEKNSESKLVLSSSEAQEANSD